MYVDAHCHIERDTFKDGVDKCLERAFDAGLTDIIAVGATRVVDGAHEAVALAEAHEHVFATAGIHPHDAAGANDETVAVVENYLEHPKVVALGEIGLDYYYDNSPRDVQLEVFRRFLHIGKERNIPIMLHVRDAHDDCLKLLDEVGLPERGGVVHCFTAGPELADEYLKRGFYLSIPGVITFKNAEPLREAVRRAPLEKLFIETDSPYLAPIPHRGKRNEPAYVVHTAEAIGKLRGLSGEDIGRITRQNTLEFFGLDGERQTALAYAIRNSLYVNLTSHCTLGCTFCPKIERRDWWVRGHWLRHRKDPASDAVLSAVDDELARRNDIEEIVFVGLGEPTLALDTLLTVAKTLRQRHGKRYRLRVDTDGLGSLVHGRDITGELAAVFDALSVSLNAADAQTYARICPSKYGEAAYPAVKDFIGAAKEQGMEVTATCVGVPDLDVEACRKIAEKDLGVAFRHRVYQEYG